MSLFGEVQKNSFSSVFWEFCKHSSCLLHVIISKWCQLLSNKTVPEMALFLSTGFISNILPHKWNTDDHDSLWNQKIYFFFWKKKSSFTDLKYDCFIGEVTVTVIFKWLYNVLLVVKKFNIIKENSFFFLKMNIQE